VLIDAVDERAVEIEKDRGTVRVQAAHGVTVDSTPR
jgi:hypothetical protein